MRKKALITLRGRIAVSLKSLTLLHLIFLIFFLFAMSKVGHAQTYLAHLDTCYLLLDEVPNKNVIELAPENDYFPKILLYNISVDNPESEVKYLLTISVLPNTNHRSPSKKRISKASLRKKKLSYERLKEVVIASIDSSLQNEYYFPSQDLKTYNIIPIVQEEDGYYAYDNPVLSECFGIVRKPAPFRLEELKRKDWVYITQKVAPFFRAGIMNLSAPLLNRQDELKYAWWIVDEGSKALNTPLREGIDSTNFAEQGNNQFINRVLLRSIDADSTYHFEYTPSEILHGPPRTGLTSFYYHPCLGTIAATYEYHFEKYHRWIPGVKRVEEVMFTGRFINGVEYEHYFRMKCGE